MSIRVAIEHRTVYRYDRPVELGPHVIRLRPAPHCRTPIHAYSLRVTPREHFLNWQQDPYGNHLARVVFPKPANELTVTVDIVAELVPLNPFDFFVEERAETWPFAYAPEQARDLSPYLAADPDGPLITRWLAEVERTQTPVVDFLVALNHRVRDTVDYSVRMEHGVLSPEETLERRLGSCRDSAWLLVQILRRLGIAARFASGYLVQLAEDSGPQRDFTDLHAWAEAYVPGAGWIGLDATSGLLAGEGHLPLACTASPAAAAPIEGELTPAQTSFEHFNLVRRVHEPPRTTKPYDDEQWQRIDALGSHVDERLRQGDVRLTIGGEPTFVCIAELDEPEWNTAAIGGHKLELAIAFTRRLAERFAGEQGGFLIQHGQGKWYPGEPLPRWQIGVHWRLDGRPLWRSTANLADPSKSDPTHPARPNHAAALAHAIAEALGIPPELRYPAHEDPVPRFWAQARLPDGEPPPEMTVPALDAGASEPSGYALPLYRAPGEDHWSTGRWHVRRERLFLIEGDSPIGLRLPLDSLTWTPPEQHPEQSLFRDVAPLRIDPAGPTQPVEPPPITAVCVELRDGHVHVFMPPLEAFEHFAELLAIVEDAAAATGTPVVIEGYGPPRDPRAQRFVVTPDPGVIEVNIHPSASWEELVERTAVLAEEAAALGLGTEKFAIDGAHAGTGGGSHLTLGGPTPPDSPLLRRPDLLCSMLTYWQHHPSLSYLFSGRFVGPTSQAPRIDEARHESLYELEVAFSELDRLGDAGPTPAPSWLVDRALRHLLTDLTGNTHRAEFCIDKLYSPDHEAGRLGVLELRGFEMAPHPQMALVQALLVRALVARLWRDPYRGPLVRWGTELHDRFMLPWWVQADAEEVVADLRTHGFAFEREWLAPFLEFRFPRLGEVTVAGTRIELRAAIEPWLVLGEEPAGGGTARYVDSSLERLQVRVDGLVPERQAVACNGFALPLQATETPGTYVAGVRYRAWQPPSALHPTIAVHTPLTFDLVDVGSSRALGGCRYHVVHPGGRAYERLPVNAAEAAARRAGRFEPHWHSPGKIELAVAGSRFPGRLREYPRTLDLRRP